jgi:predicted dehydrogenase
MEKVLALLAEGAIGRPHVFQGSFTFRLTRPDNIRFQPELGGGALMDVGCYCVNAARTIAGREPDEVQAYATWHATGVDSRMSASLRFGPDFTAQFDCALTMARRESFLVAGDVGYLTVDDAFLPGTKDVIVTEHHGRDEPLVHEIDGVDEYQLMVEHFADCILQRRPVRYSATEAAANMRVIEALYRSARNNGLPEAL